MVHDKFCAFLTRGLMRVAIVSFAGFSASASGQETNPLDLHTEFVSSGGNGCKLIESGGKPKIHVQVVNPNKNSSQVLVNVDFSYSKPGRTPPFMVADFLKERENHSAGTLYKNCYLDFRVKNRSGKSFELVIPGFKFVYLWQLEKGEGGHDENSAYIQGSLRESGERRHTAKGQLVDLDFPANIFAPFRRAFATTCARDFDIRVNYQVFLKGLVGEKASGSKVKIPNVAPMNGDARLCG